jgi:hypothetical protein
MASCDTGGSRIGCPFNLGVDEKNSLFGVKSKVQLPLVIRFRLLPVSVGYPIPTLVFRLVLSRNGYISQKELCKMHITRGTWVSAFDVLF